MLTTKIHVEFYYETFSHCILEVPNDVVERLKGNKNGEHWWEQRPDSYWEGIEYLQSMVADHFGLKPWVHHYGFKSGRGVEPITIISIKKAE